MKNKNISDNEIDNLIIDLEPCEIQYVDDDLCKVCEEPKLLHCCNVMIENITHLKPPRFFHSKIHSKNKIEVKIEKVCAGAIIISGIIHKALHYRALLKNVTINSCYKKNIDIPFNCFISIDEANEDDEYEIIGYDIICAYAKTTDINGGCSNSEKSHCKHTEKVLIKICVMRK